MKQFATEQRAYDGRFALLDAKTGALIRGGGVTAPRPRLYETAEAAIEASEAYRESLCEPVELV